MALVVASGVRDVKLAPLSVNAFVDAVAGSVEVLSAHIGWSVMARRVPVALDVEQTRVPLAQVWGDALGAGEAAPRHAHRALHDHEQQQRSQQPGSPFHPRGRHTARLKTDRSKLNNRSE